jgi:uncharacterized protein YaiI (UPF0178 family)
MVLWIDADGCPVVSITEQVAESLSIELHVVKNISHHLELHYAQVHTVDHGADQVDFFIANRLTPGDLVITQDYGLAAMAIAKKAFALTQYGQLIDSQNIDYLLEKRHFHKELRKQSNKYTKFKKRTAEDDRRYLEALKETLKKLMIVSPTL